MLGCARKSQHAVSGPGGWSIAFPTAGTSHGALSSSDQEWGYEQQVASVTTLQQQIRANSGTR
jgi:hypothetical protein